MCLYFEVHMAGILVHLEIVKSLYFSRINLKFYLTRKFTTNYFCCSYSAPSDPVNGPHGEGYDPSNYEFNLCTIILLTLITIHLSK